MFNFQQLETLVHCVECGSFSAAARKLKKAQSAISTSIANLEIDTGITIFDRSTRKPTLTPQGQRLYRQALNLLAQANNLRSMTGAFNAGVEESLTIFINPLLLTPAFFTIVDEFYCQFPHTELDLQLLQDNDVEKALLQSSNAIGFKLWDHMNNDHLEVGVVGYLPFAIAVNHMHPLLSESAIEFSQLSDYRQVLLERCPTHIEIHYALQTIRTNNLECAMRLLNLDNSWGFLPQHTIEKAAELTKLTLVAEERNWLLQIDRITKKHQPRGPALTWFYQQSSRIYDEPKLFT